MVTWQDFTEGALVSGVNAAVAVVKKLGGQLRGGSPLEADPKQYHYRHTDF
jgi:hypothetical protein